MCALCKKGDHVYVGTKVADSDAYVSVPIHSSVSGTVKEIKKVIMPGGQAVDAVIITSDGLMEHDPAVCPPPEIKTKQQLADAARASGLVGLGGAGFPAHVKLNVPPDKKSIRSSSTLRSVSPILPPTTARRSKTAKRACRYL